MLQFINYFCVPALAVLLYEKDPVHPTRLLAVYMSFTAAIVPCTRVMTSVFCRIWGGDVPVDSPEYTIFALLTAAILPLALKLIRTYTSLKLVERELDHV